MFQLVPQRFGAEIGLMTGLIGMAGGVGGFLLAAGLGVVKQHAGSYAPGLWLFAGVALAASLSLSASSSAGACTGPRPVRRGSEPWTCRSWLTR